MTWRAIARSSIGTSHQKRQMPCQDYGQYIAAGDLIVGAVADGAGSAKYADVGAKLAVKTALTNLEEWLGELESTISESEAKQLFSWLLETVIAAMQEEAIGSGHSLQDLACTLLIVIAAPDWIAAMQIGDGFLLVKPQGGDYQLLFQPSKGEFFNETTFVTSSNALNEMQVCTQLGNQEFICAATDGLERVAIHLRNWAPFTPFFQPLVEYMQTTGCPEQDDEYLLNFLNSDRLNSRTDDDKTLLLCLYDAPKEILGDRPGEAR